MSFNRNNKRRLSIESLENKRLLTADSGMEMGGGDTLQAEVQEMEADEPVCYLKYKLDRAFIKSWSTSGDADDRPTEEVAFYYNKLAFAYGATSDGRQ